MTDIWQASRTYVPGSLVKPSSAGVVTTPQPANPSFESGDLTSWTTADPSRWTIASDTPYKGTYLVRVSGSGLTSMHSDTTPDVVPGRVVTVTAKFKITNHGTDDAAAQAVLEFLDSGGNVLPTYFVGALIHGKGGYYASSLASGAAPANAVAFRIKLSVNPGTHGSTVECDDTSYGYSYQEAPAGLIFKATQAAPGKSGSAEPSWPTTTGVPVTDNEVTWEGVIASRVVWEASPLMLSGATEPTWPDDPGAMVRDGTIDWMAVSPQIVDSLLPNSKIVTIAANKVFVGDGDITRYCATNDATDWQKQDDAGYLPTGLLAIGETQVTALGIYRSNLIVWTASSMEVWQPDPDPSRMSIIDTVEGVGTDYIRCAVGMMNDLYFLSGLGVRSVSVAATTGTMGATDVGSPVDALVRPDLAALTSGSPIGVFYANASQLWQSIGDKAYVYSISSLSKVFAWSQYILPWTVTDACVLNGSLYVRTTENDVYVLDESLFADDVATIADESVVVTSTNYTVVAQLPWQDLGAPGVEKMLDAVDVVIECGDPAALTGIAIGYDERDESAFTDAINITGDTRPGDVVPVPAGGVSLSPKFTHTSDASWEMSAATLYYYLTGPQR